jgi:CO/xanthine dehydrogenase Mo-binding subunit
MMNAPRFPITRRNLLLGTGALVVSFSLADQAFAQEGELNVPAKAQEPAPAKGPVLPGSLADTPSLDAWIRIDADNSVTVYTGKAELGQGTKTSLRQIAAEELEVPPSSINLITADTFLTADEGFTAGSQTIQNSGTAIRNAAAQVREILIEQASQKLQVPADQLKAKNGRIVGPDGKSIGYGEVVVANLLHVNAQPKSKLKSPDAYEYIGKPFARVDIPGKVTGGAAYVQDMRLPGMLHARVVRPPSWFARLTDVDTSSIKKMPGVVEVIQDGNFLAVVAEKEFQSVQAMRALTALAHWEEKARMPNEAELPAVLEKSESQVGVVAEAGGKFSSGVKTYSAQFTRPYQMHASIGPSCSVAHLDNGVMNVWTHTQGVYPDRNAIAQMLGMPKDKVRCIHTEGSGCYGHNGADDAAGDAALIAKALPGRPIRVQWMRDQEHLWEPYGPAMMTKVSASLDATGKIVDWRYDLWSNTHSARPGTAGALLSGQLMAAAFPPDAPVMAITPLGNGDRNAIPLYTIPNQRVLWHFIADMPLRVSSLRGLGAYANVFSIESFMDQLAKEANADPVEFRLKHMDDPRARKVMTTVAEAFNWSNEPLPAGRGRGFAFAKYKNHAAYLAQAMDIDVDQETGRIHISRIVSAVDCGEAVNLDSIRNQTEGGIIQSLSWTMYEAVNFDNTHITSSDWQTYPIMRFSGLPDSIDVHVVNNPGSPYLGVAEAAQGPTSAALANAIANATGKRLYDLPFSPARVKATLGV